MSDPHFTGLRGQKYDVTGTSGHVYSILSDEAVAVNARFGTAYTTGLDAATGRAYHAKGTWMTALGVVTPDGAVTVSADGTVTLNGDTLHEGPGEEGTDAAAAAGASLRVAVTWPVVEVSTAQMDLEVRAVPPPAEWGASAGDGADATELTHLNLRLGNYHLTTGAHGLLGASAAERGGDVVAAAAARGADGEGVIEGSVEDYQVPSLTSTEFKFSAYGRGASEADE